MKMKKIAFIGVGGIGNPMAKCLIRSGFNLVVYDVRKAAMNNLLAMGATAAANLSECAANEAIVVMVANDAQVEEVVCGSGGILDSLPAGAHPIVTVMSTIAPTTVKRIGALCQIKGIDIMDAPVSGTHIAAEHGKLSIMVGGSERTLEIMRPVLAAMAKNIYHAGGLGAGEAAKLVNNILGVTNMFLTIEALEVGIINGLSLEKLLSIVETSSGTNFYIKNWVMAKDFYSYFSQDRPTAEILLSLCLKDLEHAYELEKASNYDSPLLRNIIGSFKEFTPEYVMHHWNRLMNEAGFS